MVKTQVINIIFFQKLILENNFWHKIAKDYQALVSTCLSRQDVRTICIMTLKVQSQNMTSGQGHALTQIGYAAYNQMHLEVTYVLRPFPSLYVFSLFYRQL